MKPLEIQVAIQVAKPVEEVFEGIVDPQKMMNYFISSSSGRIEEGKTLEWEFPEFEGKAPVKILKVISPTYIAFEWDGAKNTKMEVRIELSEMPDASTLVQVTEGSMENNEAGILWFQSNTHGWANFLACLKAYLDYGINLRKGAFDYMRP